jgi:2-oxo-hept-3-ene-1,7-dioate hydratase
VLGGRAVRVHDADLRWAGAILSRNAVVEETGLAAGVLNHPVNGVVWLARKLAQHGVALESDQVVLSGSFTRPVFARKGDTFMADYGSLGTVNCFFG